MKTIMKTIVVLEQSNSQSEQFWIVLGPITHMTHLHIVWRFECVVTVSVK